METYIKKHLSGKQMESIFQDCTNIRHYDATNLENRNDYNPDCIYLFEINIRHAEDQDPNTLFQEAKEKLFPTNKVISKELKHQLKLAKLLNKTLCNFHDLLSNNKYRGLVIELTDEERSILISANNIPIRIVNAIENPIPKI